MLRIITFIFYLQRHDDIITFLDEGLVEPDTFTPEMEVEFYDGDFNIEYVVIYDEDGKALFKDPNYKYV